MSANGATPSYVTVTSTSLTIDTSSLTGQSTASFPIDVSGSPCGAPPFTCTETINLNILHSNSLPQVQPVNLITPAGSPLTVNVLTRVTGYTQVLGYQIDQSSQFGVSSPSYLQVTGSTFTLTPPTSGYYRIIFTVANVGSSGVTVADNSVFTITSTPVCVGNSASTTFPLIIQTTIATGVTSNDIGVVSVALITNLNGLTLFSDGSYEYNPAQSNLAGVFTANINSFGNDYSISSDINLRCTQTLIITVNPLCQPDTFYATVGTPTTINTASGVKSNDGGVTSVTLVVGSVTGPVAGFALSASGAVTFTPTGPGIATFQYRGVAGGLTCTTTATINIDQSICHGFAYYAWLGVELIEYDTTGLLQSATVPGLWANRTSTPTRGTALVSPDGSFTYLASSTVTPGVARFTYAILTSSNSVYCRGYVHIAVNAPCTPLMYQDRYEVWPFYVGSSWQSGDQITLTLSLNSATPFSYTFKYVEVNGRAGGDVFDALVWKPQYLNAVSAINPTQYVYTLRVMWNGQAVQTRTYVILQSVTDCNRMGLNPTLPN